MHSIEPFYNWRNYYIAEGDPDSPFFGREYSEFEFSNTIYNYYVHPQWDFFGAETICLKILFADYNEHYVIIEIMGEWNDSINNDSMFLKRDFIDKLLDKGIRKFILIGENVFNFHGDTDDYYAEWFDDIDLDGWIVFVNFREHVTKEMKSSNIDNYVVMEGSFNDIPWRNYVPHQLYSRINKQMQLRLG